MAYGEYFLQLSEKVCGFLICHCGRLGWLLIKPWILAEELYDGGVVPELIMGITDEFDQLQLCR